jgi:hypothetical protein
MNPNARKCRRNSPTMTTIRPKGPLMKFSKLALLGAILCPGLAFGAACSGPSPFTDVGAASGFCSNVEWLKNRAITLGANCPPAAAPSYCPNDYVTRLQMAAFMNRLADAIVPPPMPVEEAIAGAMTLTALYTDTRRCVSNVFAAANYPRIFTMSTHLSLLSAAGTATIGVQPLYSIDNGVTWVAPNTQPETVGLDATYTGHVTSEAMFQVPATKTVLVAQGIASISGATGIAANGRCHTLVRVQSVTGGSSPYDVPDGMPDVE